MADKSLRERWELVRGSNIQPSLRLTLYCLHCFQGTNETAFCDRETLADEVGVNVDQLTRKFQALESLGVIQRVWTKRNGRPSREFIIDYEVLKSCQRSTLTNSSECTLMDSSECEEPTLTNSSVAPRRIHQSHSDEFVSPTHIEDSGKIQGRSRKGAALPKVSSPNFSEWYKIYPRKVGRPKAEAAYLKSIQILTKRHQSQQEAAQWLNEVTSKFADSPSGQAGQYTPHPATWLNQGRYDDDQRDWANGGTVNGATVNPEAETAWQAVLDSLKRRSRFKPDEIRADIGERSWQAVQPIGLKRIDEANEFDRRELKAKFIKAFTEQRAA